MAVTTPDRYALGRNTTLQLLFRSKTLSNGVYSYSNSFDAGFEICISEGSVSLDTDTIEINSNCQSGWKIKLPSLKSGTISGTGYIAVTTGATGPFDVNHKYNLYKYLGDTCQVYVVGTVPEISNTDALVVEPNDSAGANGFFKTGSVSISPDDAIRISFTIELSGAQDVLGLVATSAIS